MLVFADRDFYVEFYLMGRSPVVPVEQIGYWLTEATAAINFKNIADDELESLFASVSSSTMDKLKRATCRIAEIMYSAERGAGTPDEKAIRSETVDEYSVSYESQKRTEDEIQRDIGGVVKKWLSGSELHNAFVWRG